MRKLRIVESPTCVASIHGIILLSNPKKVSRGKPYTFHVPLLNTHTVLLRVQVLESADHLFSKHDGRFDGKFPVTAAEKILASEKLEWMNW